MTFRAMSTESFADRIKEKLDKSSEGLSVHLEALLQSITGLTISILRSVSLQGLARVPDSGSPTDSNLCGKDHEYSIATATNIAQRKAWGYPNGMVYDYEPKRINLHLTGGPLHTRSVGDI